MSYDYDDDTDESGDIPFPLHAYPKVLREFARAAALSAGARTDVLAPLILGSCAAAIGRSRCIYVKGTAGNWTELPSLYLLLVGRKSSKKTPALNLVVEPLRQIDQALHEEYLKEHEIWEMVYRDSKDKDVKAEHPEPVEAHFLVQDSTIEALHDLLPRHPRGVVVYRDELAAWLKSMGQYKNGQNADRAAWLSLYNGKSVTVTRVRRPTVRVSDPAVTVIGGTQPGELTALTSADDGLTERFLVVFVPKVLADMKAPGVSSRVLNNYRELIGNLYRLEGEPIEQTDKVEPVPLKFEDDAYASMLDYLQLIENEAYDNDDDEAAAMRSKDAGTFVRLIIVLTEMWAASGERAEIITEEMVENAWNVTEFFSAQSRYVFLSGAVIPSKEFTKASPEAADVLRNWHEEHIEEYGGCVGGRWLTKSGPRKLRNLSTETLAYVAAQAGVPFSREARANGTVTLWIGKREGRKR